MKTAIIPVSPQTRREFCAHACQAASLLTVGALASACGGSSPSSPSSTNVPQLSTLAATVTGRVVSVTIDPAGALGTPGSAAAVQTSLGTFLLARTGQDSFTALTAICTHEACTVSGFQSSQYVCPCHGSRYSTAGAVVTGPATRALTQYGTQFASNVLTFTA
jgi:cytochrome b6-f complex iron-sulfur subunit